MAQSDTAALLRAPSGVLVVTAIASVQFGSSIAAKLFGRVGPAGAVSLRIVFGTVLLLAIWRPRLRAHGRGDLMLAALFGLILAGMNLSFYEALHRIPLGVAVTVEFVGPLAVAVAGSRKPVDVLWVALAATGILALTQGGGHAANATGLVLALTAGCLWASYIVVSARVGRRFRDGTGLALALCVATVATLPVGIADGGAHLLEPRSLILGAAVGLLSTAIPYSLELEALRRIAPAVFGVLMSLEPAMAALAGLLVLGQGLSARALVGIALVVAASAGASRRTSAPPVDM